MATPVTLVPSGSPITPSAQGTPVTIVGSTAGSTAAVLFVGDEFEVDGGGTVTIDAIVNGVITEATYTAP
jgi:hypothetical protein